MDTKGFYVLIFCFTIVHHTGGQVEPSVGISNNYHDVLLSFLSPHPVKSSNQAVDPNAANTPQQPGSAQTLGSQEPAPSSQGFNLNALMEMIAGQTGNSNQQTSQSTNQGSTNNIQSNQANAPTIADFNLPTNVGSGPATGGMINPPPKTNAGGYFQGSPVSEVQSSAMSNYFNPSASGPSSNNVPSQNAPGPDSLLAALEMGQSQKAPAMLASPPATVSRGDSVRGSIPGSPLTQLLGTHPASQSSRNPMVDSLLRGNSAGHPTNPTGTKNGFKPTIHKAPANMSLLGKISGQKTAAKATSGSIPSGAATQGTAPAKTSPKPNLFQIRMQSKLYNIKVSKMAPVIQLYEQEGCINPLQYLPTKIAEVAKAAFSSGCQDPNAQHFCHMAQLKTPGFSAGKMNTQILLQSMMTPESRARIGTMLAKMSPSSMMSSGSGLGSLMAGLGGGGEMMNAEMMDRVLQLRQKLFPLQCQEVSLSSMFKIGMCCHGQIDLPQNYILSKFLAGSFNAK